VESFSVLKVFIIDKEMGTCFCSSFHTIDYFRDRIDEIPLTLAGTEKQCFVNRVLDGDTIEIIYFHPTMLRGKFENIQRKILRLADIDAPEIHSKDIKEKEKGNISKEFLSSLILNKVVLIRFVKEEKYGRLMGTIFLNEEDINNKMIQNGMAREYHGEKKDKWVFD